MSEQPLPLEPAAGGAGWQWFFMGNPSSGQLVAPVGTATLGGALVLLVADSAGQLWSGWLSAAPPLTWQWALLGQPAGVQLMQGVGVMYNGDPVGFALDGQGALWSYRLQVPLSGQWRALGQPPTTGQVLRGAGATGLGSQGSTAGVFVLDSLGALWLCASRDYATWTWSSLGQPASGPMGLRPIGALNVNGAASVFVLDTTGLLWVCLQQSDGGWQWVSLPPPPPESGRLSRPLAAAWTGNGPGVFVLDDTGTLWACQLSSSSGWQWSSLGAPSGAQLFLPLGLVTLDDGSAWIFAQDGTGTTWYCWSAKGAGWQPWQPAAPPSQGGAIVRALGAGQGNGRPFVFGVDTRGYVEGLSFSQQ